ncbi:hypothetical protein HMPREF6485_1877 [Segatella buccae ATCC 33574]|uniref:Uncharacterized protein n=1 Tax=Segatella buccae ATCC 33574 TaxID=873513 RepID=E6K8E1_9BACT|nr:hypothetical protein HMPREF6485_1877 [Segatella buccae ATCC 33574]
MFAISLLSVKNVNYIAKIIILNDKTSENGVFFVILWSYNK